MRIIAALLITTACFGQLPVNRRGNGPTVQMTTGAITTNDCVKYDSTGNAVDAGISCGVSLYINTPNYDFTAQTPGGSLSAGVPATITLSPAPQGVSGSHTVAANLPHLMYLFGGTGTAEATPITGGTCNGTGSQSSCTITLTPANNHSAAWQIKSNTSGVQEAVYVAGASGGVRMPCSTIDLWANTGSIAALVVPDGFGTSIRGCGKRNTSFSIHGTTGDWFNYEFVSAAGSVDVGDFQMIPTGTVTAGTCLKIRYRADGIVSNILTSGCYDSIVAEGNARVLYDDLQIYNKHYGFSITCFGVSGAACSSQVSSHSMHVISTATGSHGIHIQDQTTGIIFNAPFIEGGINPVGSGDSALYILITAAGPSNEIIINGGFLDSHAVCANLVGNGSSFNNNSVQFTNVHFACSNYAILASAYFANVTAVGNYMSATGGGVPGNAGVIALAGPNENFVIASNKMDSDGQACFYISGATTNLSGIGNVCGTIAQPANGVNISATVTGGTFKGNTFSTSGAVYTASVDPSAWHWSGNTGSASFKLSLFSAPTEGETAPVSDSSTVTWGATITGGSTNHVMGYYDGTQWTVAAK